MNSDTVIKRMATHIMTLRADSTVSKYSYQIKHFKEFCEEKGFPSTPAYSIHVAIYLSHLIDIGKSDKVITSVFYAIKWMHNINDYADPTESSFVKNILECAKRLNSKPVIKKETISSEFLIELCNMYSKSTDVIDLRDLTMILLCYSGLLRFSEVSDLRCNDTSFKSDHLILKIRKSKIDIYRSGKEVLISKGNTCACPYSMLERYLTYSGLKKGSDSYLFQPACRTKSKCFF